MNKPEIIFLAGLFFTVLLFGCQRQDRNSPLYTWKSYLGDKQSTQYSILDQINKSNVSQLEVAWEYHTDDSKGREIQCNPLIIDSLLYATTGQLKCIALNAATGKLVWSFNPYADTKVGGGNNRGLAYWEDGTDKRIFHSAGSRLYALNALTGGLISGFGDHGSIDLHIGLGERAKNLWVILTTPGVIYHDLYIFGSRVSEGFNSAPGYVRAIDVRTGKLVWTFHTIPLPGEYGYDTWPKNAYKTVGGVNSWGGMTLDEERGIVYIPTGSAAFDSYGGNRIGKDLFANCLLALKAETGERIWHYQTIHHDVWDYDLPSPPNLLTITRNGTKVPVVAQTTKTGNTFVFNRLSGKPIFPLKEINIDSSDVPGEQAWPVEPVPVLPPPFIRQVFTRDQITDLNPEAHQTIEAAYDTLRAGKMMIPPSLQGTIVFPGFDGGAEWGGAAVDPYKGILYVNANVMVWTVKLFEIKDYLEQSTNLRSPGRKLFLLYCSQCHGADLKGDKHYGYPSLISIKTKYDQDEVNAIIKEGKGMMPGHPYLTNAQVTRISDYLFNKDTENLKDTDTVENMPVKQVVLPYAHHGFHRLLDPEGYPAIKPPWGILTAIDLNEGKILWQVPFGEFEKLKEKEIPRTGTENYGGPVVTAGGLIIIGASKDEKLHIFDKDTGKLLWEFDLPAGGYATPATYMMDGKQYLVIACGGDKMGTKSGDSYMAFRLRNK